MIRVRRQHSGHKGELNQRSEPRRVQKVKSFIRIDEAEAELAALEPGANMHIVGQNAMELDVPEAHIALQEAQHLLHI